MGCLTEGKSIIKDREKEKEIDRERKKNLNIIQTAVKSFVGMQGIERIYKNIREKKTVLTLSNINHFSARKLVAIFSVQYRLLKDLALVLGL